MSEETLRLLGAVGVGALAAALALAALLRALPAPRPATAAAACGALVQVGLYTLLIGAWRGTGSTGWPLPGAGFALCALPAHVLCVVAALRYGRRTLPATTALFVLGSLGVVWAARLGGRDPALSGAALTAGGLACAGLAFAGAHAARRPVLSRALRSPWTWTALSAALLGATFALGVRTAGGTVVGLEVAGVFVQPSELAFKLVLPLMLATGLAHASRPGPAEEPPRSGFPEEPPRSPRSRWRSAAPLLAGFAGGFALPLLALREHGTLVLGGLLFAATVAASGRLRRWAGPALAAACVLGALAAAEPRVRSRLVDGLAPVCAPGHEDAQRCTAATTAASSELLGRGIAAGRAERVPQAATDFPVSGFAEELGVPGLAVLWGALALLVHGLVSPLRGDPARSARAGAVVALLLAVVVQAAWSHWMNLGLFLPVMGVPFPWLSFSGTTVFASTLAAGGAALLAWSEA